jgi:hypothetical protein
MGHTAESGRQHQWAPVAPLHLALADVFLVLDYDVDVVDVPMAHGAVNRGDIRRCGRFRGPSVLFCSNCHLILLLCGGT